MMMSDEDRKKRITRMVEHIHDSKYIKIIEGFVYRIYLKTYRG